MSRRQTFRCFIEWRHRKWGPQSLKSAAEGTSIRRAMNNALLAFFSDSNEREKRRDAHSDISIHAWRVRKEAAK